jgi:hypothetical protein
MSFPGQEQDNPQRVSTAVNTAGFVQDVVVAATRLLHDEDLSGGDRAALEDCRDLLSGMLSTDITLVRSSERHLGDANTVALLRRTRSTQPQGPGDLESVVTAISQLLEGRRDAELLEHARRLRQTFLAVAEANLADMTRHDPAREVSDSWTGLIANSIS